MAPSKREPNAHRRHDGPSFWAVPLAIFCCALAIRMVYLAEDSHSPFFAHRGMDVMDYHSRAVGWLNGTWPGNKPFFWPPLYPMFLGVLYKTIGQGIWGLKVVHALIGSASCVLVWAIGRQVFKQRFVPIAAAVMCSLCGTLIFFDGQLLSGSLDVFLQLASLWLLLAAARRDRLGLWAVAGLCLGLSGINRGGTLLFLPVILLWMYLRHSNKTLLWHRRPGGGNTGETPVPQVLEDSLVLQRGSQVPHRDEQTPAARRGFWKPATALLIALCVVVLPVSWHNVRYDRPQNAEANKATANPLTESLGSFLTGGFAFISSNAGLNFYLGNHWALREVINVNHPDCFAYYWKVRREPIRHGIEAPGEQSRYLLHKTLRDIAQRPADWARLMGLKLFQLASGSEIPRNINLYASRNDSAVLSVLLWKRGMALPMGLIIPLGIVGAFLARRESDRHLLLVGCLVMQAVFVLAFFVTARYRLPMIPLLSLYAAYALRCLVDRARQRQVAKLYLPVGLLAGLLVISNFRVGTMTNTHGAYEYDWLAVDLSRQGHRDEAMTYLAKALEIEPAYAPGHLHLGTALFHENRLPESIAELSKAVEGLSAAGGDSPMLADAHANLGRSLAKSGRLEKAVEHFKEAIRLSTHGQAVSADSQVSAAGGQAAQAWLLEALASLGHWNEAVTAARKAVDQSPNQPEPLDRLAQLLLHCPDKTLAGNGSEAVRLAEKACELTRRRNPTFLRTLAAAYQRIGEPNRAAAVAAEAAALTR